MDLFRGGVNCCYRHSVHQMLARIPEIGRSKAFMEYLETDLRSREGGKFTDQEDAGSYLANLIDREHWLKKLWNRECGIRFMEKRIDKPNSKTTLKRLTDKDPLLVVYPNQVNEQSLSEIINHSLTTSTDTLEITKRVCHPPPRYLLINLAGKLPTSTPLRYFSSINFGPIRYEPLGYVIHLGMEFTNSGHYVYMTKSGLVFDDLTIRPFQISLDNNFDPLVSPTLIIYRRVTRRYMGSRMIKH